MLAAQITNQSNLFDIGAESLQFVMDFMYALDELEEADLFLLNKRFNKQKLVKFETLVVNAASISEKVNITTTNHSKN